MPEIVSQLNFKAMQRENLAEKFWHVVRRSFIDESVESFRIFRIEAHTMNELDQKLLLDLYRGKEFSDFTGYGRLSVTSAWYRCGNRVSMVFTILGQRAYANAVIRFDVDHDGPISVLTPDTCTFIDRNVAQNSPLKHDTVKVFVDLGQEFDTSGDWVIMVKQPIVTDYNFGKFVSYFKPVHPNVRFWNPFADVDFLFQSEFLLNDLLSPVVTDDPVDLMTDGFDDRTVDC